jgi:hypothetical protein
MNADGTITVASNTPAGSYLITYTICEVSNPTNCSTVTSNVTVTAPVIAAVNDTATINGFTGGTFTNVLSNDTINGVAVVASQVNTTLVSSTNAGITLSGTNVIVAAGTPAGTYTLIYKICEILNPTNCSQAVVTITIACAPITAPILTTTQPSCSVATGTVTVTTPLDSSLTYSIDGNFYQASPIFSGLVANSYNVTVKNTGGCISTATVAVINSQPTTPASPTVALTQPTCSVATGTITVSAPTGTGLTYSINNSTYQTSPIFSGLVANSYNVTVKNASGCISTATVAVITAQPTAPASPTVALTQPTCSVVTGTITVSAPTGTGLTYSINNSTYQTSPIFSGLASNSYNVTVKNASGCISNATVAVITAKPTTPASPTVALTQPTCAVAGTITISAPTGTGLTYSINNSTYQTSPIFSGLAANSYNVTVKNASGCISNATVAVINAQPTTCNGAGIFHTNVTCADYKNNSSSQLVGQLCYTTSSNKISNVTPGQFFYYTTIIAPSASFCIDIVQTKSSSSLALFSINQLDQFILWDASCVKKATGIQVSLGLGRICISNATIGAKYVLAVKYDAKSVIGAAYTGTAPVCQYNFESRINGVTVANSSTQINMKPNCTSTVAKSKSKDDEVIKTNDLEVTLAPNPSSNDFVLYIKSLSDERITIRIIDIHGRLIRQFKSTPKEIIRFGSELTKGLYFIEVIQEGKREVVKAQKI